MFKYHSILTTGKFIPPIIFPFSPLFFYSSFFIIFNVKCHRQFHDTISSSSSPPPPQKLLLFIITIIIIIIIIIQ